ncbi:hypothetical protein HYW75_06185 [Candidatus Pacearchaeota archaeon]|nr:hypothetical protein [Candidatus Pacearchaeota archaeon]
MTKINCSKYEIVGMNGSILGNCGRTLTVGHLRNTDNYFLSDRYFFENEALREGQVYGITDLTIFQKQKRLILFERPFPMLDNALALYASKSCLSYYNLILNGEPLGDFDGTKLTWQELPGDKNVFVTCAQTIIVDALLARLGKGPEYYKNLAEKLKSLASK